jgi:predicted TIM-barrel fold metal-dependent hydrolase
MPVFATPRGAVDTHVHVFDPARFPFAADTPYRPAPCECGNVVDLERVLDAHDIERVVVVNPSSAYGDDNACMLDALSVLGRRARGIARVPLEIPRRELETLSRRGVVGIRVDFIALGIGVASEPTFPRLLASLADCDLLCDIQAQGEQWGVIAPMLANARVRVVIDHMGRPDPATGVEAPAFRAMLGLASAGRTIVKLSGADRFSRTEPPYGDTAPFAAAIVREFTCERLVWGSDWPFVRSDRHVDYGPALAALASIVPDERDRLRVLCTTPAQWFGFDPDVRIDPA